MIYIIIISLIIIIVPPIFIILSNLDYRKTIISECSQVYGRIKYHKCKICNIERQGS